MIQPGKDLAFILESGKDVAGVLPGTHELERDLLLILIIGPDRAIDLSHSASPDLLNNLVRTNTPANPICFIGRKQSSGSNRKVRAVKKFIAKAPFYCHQRFEIGSKRCIFGITLLEITFAFGRIEF
jgi:hypothetical protein